MAHWVNIGGCPIKFDIRFKGDNFFDEKWQEDMLASRHFVELDEDGDGFWNLNEGHEFWSLLYHKVIHDAGVTEKYYERLGELNPFDDLDLADSTHIDHLQIVDEFIGRSGYEFISPRDWSEALAWAVSNGRIDFYHDCG